MPRWRVVAETASSPPQPSGVLVEGSDAGVGGLDERMSHHKDKVEDRE
jgi:hypothetical protein